MGITEATERQKTALRLLRALRRTTNVLAPQEWAEETPASQFQNIQMQNFYSTVYRQLFEGLIYNSNRRRAEFTGSLIASILQNVGNTGGTLPTFTVQDSGSTFAGIPDTRVIGAQTRAWCIALDENSQTFKVFDLWTRIEVTTEIVLTTAETPKLPQHIALTSPPTNSYFVFHVINFRNEEGDRIFEIYCSMLI